VIVQSGNGDLVFILWFLFESLCPIVSILSS